MKRSLFTILLLFVFNFNGFAQRYEMIWSDEFDQTELDEDIWYKWHRTAYNQEHQYYTDRDTNVYVEDGMLHLVGLRENYRGRGWTSGRIESQNNFEFQYGKVEIRAKLPEGKGLWPAFWLLGKNIEDIGWPYSGEIDIMEFRGHLPKQTSGTVHFSSVAPEDGSSDHNADRRYIGQEYDVPTGDLTSQFRLYQFTWTDSLMVWYIDDTEFFRLTREEIEAQSQFYPFDQPFYFILNLAIGGNFLGDAQPDNSTPHRNEVLVDYVRVFQDANIAPSIDLGLENTEAVEPYSNITIAPEIADEDGSIQQVDFFLNDELQSSLNAPPYAFNWQPGIDGCYDLKVRAIDNENKHSVNEQVRFVVGSGCERTPFNEEPATFPGTLELEHYDYGGLDNSYYDSTPDTNLGNAEGNDFRTTEAVDIILDENQDGNYLITETVTGEWMKYQLRVEEGGLYDLEFRSVPGEGSARINFTLDGEDWIYFTRIVQQEGEHYDVKTTADIELAEGTYDLEMHIAIDGNHIQPDYLKAILKTPTSTEIKEPIPSSFQLKQNYPNPFNPTTNISVEVESSAFSKLSVYNSLGQHIETLHSGRLPIGTHSFTFDASNLSSGVYYYQITSAEATQTRKMLLMK